MKFAIITGVVVGAVVATAVVVGSEKERTSGVPLYAPGGTAQLEDLQPTGPALQRTADGRELQPARVLTIEQYRQLTE